MSIRRCMHDHWTPTRPIEQTFELPTKDRTKVGEDLYPTYYHDSSYLHNVGHLVYLLDFTWV